ncbi:hypothetical protein HGP14_08780 [Rhizobium sp. P32RR-XVIII]|uniref:hypothetical protein n=1 Tax=Rhizobium sp. P32RR-XVIII TaxID=2726738 RepID=UPI00145747D4|nr:hypothetical protein [Rhizobium sp. P32RR-XVIII]NLS03461.1 hypothetical protein [Rhizobium sp. P32RR-XVIII]
MEIRKPFTVKELRDADRGHLVKISSGYADHDDLAFIYETDPKFAHVIVLKTTSVSGHVPYADKFPNHCLCVDYGDSWVIEPIEDTRSSTVYSPNEFGALVFAPERIILTLGMLKQGVQFKPRLFDLSAFALTRERPNEAYIVKAWKLWVNDESRRESEATPLLFFQATTLPHCSR